MRTLSCAFLAALLWAALSTAGAFRVDSVTVDSVWNSDTAEGGAGIARRAARIFFVPVADDSVTCVVDMSFDSGVSWTCDRDLLNVAGGSTSFRAAPNRRTSVTVQVRSGDTTGVVFRVTIHNDPARVSRFRLTDQIDGWTEDTASYTYFHDTRSLAAPINGGYVDYSRRGFVDGFLQSLETPDQLKYYSVMAVDFATPARASDMFAYRVESWGNHTTLPAFDTTIALAKPTLGGYSVAAHFGHFYFEARLLGYDISGPDSTAAKDEVTRFLEFYRQEASRP
jgi:hypothetical protein